VRRRWFLRRQDVLAPGGSRDALLSEVCPDPVVIQTSWYPGFIRGGPELVGPGYTIDSKRQLVRGPPVTADGVNTAYSWRSAPAVLPGAASRHPS